MYTLNNVNGLSHSEVWDKIKMSGICDQGIYRRNIAGEMEKIKKAAQGEKKAPGVVCGLNNADTTGTLLALVKKYPEKVLDGIAALAYAMETENAILYLPEQEKELAELLEPQAKERGIVIKNGIINVRETEDDLKIHMSGAADIADLMENCYQQGFYFSVDGKDVEKCAPQTKLAELIKFEGVKAVWTGYQYWTSEEAAELTVADALEGTAELLTENDCVVDRTVKILTAYRKNSCGRCVFCREGLIQLLYEQKEITENRGKGEFLGLTDEIGSAMCEETLCSLGQQAAKSAMTAFEKLQEEYTDHIKNHKCPANICGAFSHIYIDPMLCSGCGDCADKCPQDCITGKSGYIHMIDEFDCMKCGQCIKACEENAVVMTSDKLPKLPDRLTKVGRFRKR